MAFRRQGATAGERDRFVMIQALTESEGTSGFPVETFTDFVEEWMAKADLSGMERFRADQLSTRYDTRWEMPYTADMDPETVDVAKTRRLKYQGRYYDIVSASMRGRYEAIELLTLSAGRVDE